jgi:membrane protein involved in colicin uptake
MDKKNQSNKKTETAVAISVALITVLYFFLF